LQNGCKLFITILTYISSQQVEAKTEDDVLIENYEVVPQIQERLHQLLMEVMDLLTSENKEVAKFNNTFGENQKSFGNGKLKLLELILASFKI